MSTDDSVLKAAAKLAKAANQLADEQLPGRLSGIVKLHSGIAVGASFIPVPGADLAAGIANIWAMYARINDELKMPFSENLLKSVAGGVATNLGAFYAGSLIIGGVFKLFPGLGTLAGAGVIAATIYGLTITSGIVYMHALAQLLEVKQEGEITEADMKRATETVLKDKEFIKSTAEEAKRSYKK